MQPAEPGEFGLLQTGDHAEDAGLLGIFQLRLEADHVVERAERIVLAELHDGIGFVRRVRIGQPDRLHGAVGQRLDAALRHHLDRQAAFEIGRIGFPFLENRLLALEDRRNKSFVLFAGQRAIDIIRAVALVVARLEPRLREIDRFLVDDRRDRVEEGKRILARCAQNILR